MAAERSISQWLNGLHDGQVGAFQALWERFFDRLVSVADRHMRTAAMAVADGEDVAVSVFESVWSGVQAGRFKNVTDLDDAWWLLVAMAHRKCVDHIRRAGAAKRGGGQQPLSIDGDPEKLYSQLVSQEPDPQYVAALNEEHLRLVNLLRESKQREIAVLRLEGYTAAEIAVKVHVVEATVNRKLKLIRQVWQSELEDDSGP